MYRQGHDKEGPTVTSISQVSGLYLCFGNYLTHDLDLVLIDPSREVVCVAASAVAVKRVSEAFSELQKSCVHLKHSCMPGEAYRQEL